MNISYFRGLIEDVNIEAMLNGLGISPKYFDKVLKMDEVIDSTTLYNIMNYLELDLEQKLRLCTFKDDNSLYNFGVNI